MQKIILSILFVVLCLNCSFPQGFLKTSGKNIVDSKGTPILLKGTNLGNWLIQEGYMMQTSAFANAEHELRTKIEALIGVENTKAFYKAWNENYITKKDIDQIAKWGFNHVRLPMHYNKLTPKDQPGVYLEEGFATIDSCISWCKQNNIYVILDLHAAPGAQNSLNISDSYGSAELWTNEANKTRTIDLWKKIAQRYVNETWVAGYDLINETAYSFPNNNNAPLWDLMTRITQAIRQVDTNHIVFIEGNWYATDFNNFPATLWDKNMALSFHKYWNQTDVGTINYLLDLRNRYNIPLWLGESGENSNAWFTETIELMTANNIGYSFWPYKKIASISGLVTAPVTSDYQVLLNYWKSGGTKPTVDYAKNALNNMLNNLKFENCKIQTDLVDAMTRQINNYFTLPFTINKIPGTIFAVNYDLGRPGYAYSDKIYKNTNNSDAYNNGWSFRNDGVDIEKCSDIINTVGYNIGWTETGEWVKYTFNAEQSGLYDISLRAAGGAAGGKILIRIDNVQAGTTMIDVPNTGGYQSWRTIAGPQIQLNAGKHELQLQFFFGGFNLSSIDFTMNTVDVKDDEVSPSKFSLSQNYPNPFNPSTNISYEIPENSFVTLKVYDVLGNEVKVLVNEEQSTGKYDINLNASELANGTYIYRLQAGNKLESKKFILLK